jgi:hypothetical protein
MPPEKTLSDFSKSVGGVGDVKTVFRWFSLSVVEIVLAE